MAEQSKTVDKSLELLSSLRSHGPGNVSQLARRLNSSRTVVLRLLSSLQSRTLVQRIGGEYRLGYGLVELASGVDSDLRTAARRPLEVLSDTFDATAVLAVRDGADVVAIDQVIPQHRIVTVRYATGVRHPLGSGAHGVVLNTPAGPTVPYALTHDQLERGVTGLAAPITDGKRLVVAAIGVVAPSGQFGDSDSVAEAVVSAADDVSRILEEFEPITKEGLS